MKTKAKTYLLYALSILMASATIYLLTRQTVELKQAVDSLKADNSQQTVILCTLILSQNSNLSGDEVAKVEAICREKIRQTNVDTAPSNQVSAPATQVPVAGSQSGQSSSNSTPITNPSQPEKPQPTPQSLLPGVSKPIIGCITEGVCI